MTVLVYVNEDGKSIEAFNTAREAIGRYKELMRTGGAYYGYIANSPEEVELGEDLMQGIRNNEAELDLDNLLDTIANN